MDANGGISRGMVICTRGEMGVGGDLVLSVGN